MDLGKSVGSTSVNFGGKVPQKLLDENIKLKKQHAMVNKRLFCSTGE